MYTKLFFSENIAINSVRDAPACHYFSIPEFKGKSFKIGFVNAWTDSRRSTDGIEEKIVEAADNDCDIITAPEYSFVASDGILSADKKDAILERLMNATKGKNAVVIPGTFLWCKGKEVRNTAYVLQNGSMIGQYDKMKLVHTDTFMRKESDLEVVAGKNAGFFELKDYAFGLEICADNDFQVLKQWLLWHARTCDIHVIVSCGLSTPIECADYMVHNDGWNSRVVQVIKRLPFKMGVCQ